MTAEHEGRYRKWLEAVVGPLDQKRQYRQVKARMEQLPGGYRKAVEALERYMLYFGPGRAEPLLAMLTDLAELFEQSVANGTPVRAIVGDDPVEFAEEFLKNYPEGQWISRERERLTNAINQAAGDQS
ncbi:DUF1048 domain-containing protein [Herbidospora mongoliensis]|uniref:DUF1048 domain-containing protein n=1 Tax=Herbidospora mongoliensis TaxID=688067 RepID=UPI00082ADEBB|nr:DUF1048 domain-containing protein [Herbidospora mongoliensis]